MISRRTFLLRMGAALALSACFGEGELEYKGTVTEGESSGHSFDESPNPSDLAPIPGARISFLQCDGPGCSLVADPDGAWGPIDMWVAGCLFVDKAEGELKFEADGFEPYIYSAGPSDPGIDKFLNVKLRRKRP